MRHRASHVVTALAATLFGACSPARTAPPSACAEPTGSATPPPALEPARPPPPAPPYPSECAHEGTPPGGACTWRLVTVERFCGPTARWQMQQAGIDPNASLAGVPLTTTGCTCDRCATDADCDPAHGGRCLELQPADICRPPARRCVMPCGPCAKCLSTCMYTWDGLTCEVNPPPP